MKKAIIIILILAGIGFIVWKLANNKEVMAEKASLSEVVSDRIPVEIGTVIRKQMDAKVTVIGTFEAITDLTMLSQTEGLIIKVYHKKGDFVKKGTLLAQVENESMQAEVEAIKANLDKLRLDEERFEKLASKEAVTERQLEEIRINTATVEAQYKNARKKLEDTYIRATADGSINEDYVQEGSNIAKNNKLYNLVDVSKLKLNVKLTAVNILSISENDTVKVSADLYPGQSFTGKITAIAEKADNSMKYDVEILMPNSKKSPLKAGMFGQAHFEFVNPADALYFDRNALTGSIKLPTVFVVEGDHAIMKNISIGEVFQNEVQVLSGLKEGDRVVINGQINLRDSTKVRDIKALVQTESTTK